MSMDMTKRELAELVGTTDDALRDINKRMMKDGNTLFRAGEDAKKCDLAFFIQQWIEYRVKREAATMSISGGMTKEQLANLAGITYRQLYNINEALAKEDNERALFVNIGDGRKCDLTLFVRRWVEYNVERVSANAEDLDAVKAAHESVKMRKTQLEVDRMEGSLVDVQDVRRIWGDIANTVMQNMLHLPSTLAPMLRGMENVEVINSVIDTEIRKVLEGLAETPLPDYLLLQDEDDEEE